MPDYQKGKIYKLWSPQGTDEEVYYGSTIEDLRKRKSKHKQKNNNCKSKILFEKYDDVRIELVEEYSCNSKTELNKKEGEYIRNNKCLNRNIPDRTKQEYYEDNKEFFNNLSKKNYEKNKEYRLKEAKKYYEQNKEYISKYKKEYNEKNKQHILEYHKKYNEQNKEKILEKQKVYKQKNKEYLKEKITCDCGCLIVRTAIARHLKNNKHIKLMEEISNNI